MKLTFILPYYFIAVGAISSILPADFDSKTTKSKDAKLRDAIQKIVNTWATHDVTILVDNDTGDRSVERVGDTIADVSVSSYPTHLFKGTKLYNPSLKQLEMATSRTLLFYVYRLLKPTDHVSRIRLHVYNVSQMKYSPKIVLVLVADTEGVDVVIPIDIMFSYGHATVVGLEVLAKKDGSLSPTYVHRYNIATRNTSRTSYDGNVSDWYTDRYQNLMGLPVELCKLGKISGKLDKLSEVQWDVFREKMNVSFNIYPEIRHECLLAYDARYIVQDGRTLAVIGYTVPLYIDRLCLFLPNIVQKGSATMSWSLCIALLVGIVVVVLILGFSILARIGSLNRPFNVIAVMLGTCVGSMRLSSLAEKILYLCLVQVATRYMSMLYTELFSETALGQREVKINDFEDLYGLDLKIKLDPTTYYLYTGHSNSIIPPELQPMFEKTLDTDNSTAYEGNVGYFSIQLAEMYRRREQPSWPKKKKSDLCMATVMVANDMAPRLWCKERINDLLLQINQYGLREHATEWNYKWVGGENVDVEQQINDGSSVQKKMIMTLLYGYLLAVVVFLGELLIGWFRSRKVVNVVSEVDY